MLVNNFRILCYLVMILYVQIQSPRQNLNFRIVTSHSLRLIPLFLPFIYLLPSLLAYLFPIPFICPSYRRSYPPSLIPLVYFKTVSKCHSKAWKYVPVLSNVASRPLLSSVWHTVIMSSQRTPLWAQHVFPEVRTLRERKHRKQTLIN
jgi:hypothetical protein